MDELAYPTDWPWAKTPMCHGQYMRPELGWYSERLLYRCSRYAWCEHLKYAEELV